MTATNSREHIAHPTIRTAEDMIRDLREGTKAIHEVRVRNYAVQMRVLSNSETNDVRKYAISQMKMTGGDQTDMDMLRMKAVLKLASTIDKGSGPQLNDKFLDAMYVDELQSFYDEYIRISDSVNPKLEDITKEEFLELVNAIKKKRIGWRDCSLRQLRAIFLAFQETLDVLESEASRMANSSGGLPQSEQ